MATGYGTPVRFTKEKNVWDLFCIVNVGSGGALNFAQVQAGNGLQYVNKGIANVWQNTPTFTGVTASGSSSITSVSSFFGLFTGMSLTSANLPAAATIGTISPSTGSIVFTGGAAAGFTGSTGATMVAQGGQYIFQFGVMNNVGSISFNNKLDCYNRLLDFNVSYDGSTGSSIGTAAQQALAPATSQYFVIQNNITQKTVPATATSGSADASLIIQFGNTSGPIGAGFTPNMPTPGTAMRFDFTFGNTTSV